MGNPECRHDYLDPEGFCIDCGVHVSSYLSVPPLDVEPYDEYSPPCQHEDTYTDSEGGTWCENCGELLNGNW
jgi:hypothetical protein